MLFVHLRAELFMPVLEPTVLELAVETGVQDLDDVGMPALGQNIDLLQQTLEAVLLSDHVLDAHELDRDLLTCR